MFDAAICSSGVGHSRQRAAWTSLAAHTALAAVAALMFARVEQQAAWVPDHSGTRLLFVSQPSAGPGGGGGSGGDRSPRAGAGRAPGRDRATSPRSATPPAFDQPAIDSVPPEPIAIAAMPLASGADAFAGLLSPAQQANTRGPGLGDGAGTRTGAGREDGLGDGIGDGSNRNAGGGEYEPGNGVSTPRLLRDAKPNYTTDAMRARVQGTVTLECIVQSDGRIGRVRVLRSLDAQFGLDEEAIAAVRRWQFEPGRRLDSPWRYAS